MDTQLLPISKSVSNNQSDNLNATISNLINVRCKDELGLILKAFCELEHCPDNLLCFLIDKSNQRILFESDIMTSCHEKQSFQKNVLGAVGRKGLNDNNFKQEFSSLDNYCASYGLSLFYDRSASFYRIPRSTARFNEHIHSLKAITPYIHAAFNNIRYLSCSQPDIELSCRERQVIEWVAKGKTNKEIGMILYVSQFTIKNHIANIYAKLDVVNRAQAIEKAIRLNYLSY